MNTNHRFGFSMIELLVSIAIIATLMGLLLPAIMKVRVSFRRLESANNLKQIALATLSLHDDIGMLPPPCGWNNKNNTPVENGVNGTPFFMILPYLDQQPLFNLQYGKIPAQCSPGDIHYSPLEYAGFTAYRANLPISRNLANPKQFTTILDKARSGSAFTTSYLANQPLLKLRLTLNQIQDGTSNTVLYAEGSRSCSGGAMYYGTADYGSQFNFTDGLTGGNYPSPAVNPPIMPLFPPRNMKNDGQQWFIVDNFFTNSRSNSWNAGSEIVGYNPQNGVFNPPNPLVLHTQTVARPVDMIQSDFTVLPYKIVRPICELQTTEINERYYDGMDCNNQVDSPLLFEDQNNVMGNIPVFYDVPGYSFQDLSTYSSVEVVMMSFQETGTVSGAPSFTISVNGKSTQAITYSSNPAMLCQNIQAAVSELLGAQAGNVSGATIQTIRWNLPPTFGGSFYNIDASNLKNVTAVIYESIHGSAEGAAGCNWFSPQAFSGALHVAMADGSVRELSSGLSPATWNASITPNGGEVLGPDFNE